MKTFLLLLVLVPGVFACVVPEDGMVVGSSLSFCSDVYYLDNGISIVGSNIKVDCDGAVLKSWNGGKGVSIEHSSNVTLSNCRIVSYNTGIYVRNSSQVFLEDNHLVRNQVGSRFVVVSGSATFNHDVSLKSAFEIFESENNVVSLTNKRVEGDFCVVNFCNGSRNAVSLFVQSKNDVPQFHSWFLDQLTGKKSAQKLHDWVFGGFSTQGFFLG